MSNNLFFPDEILVEILRRLPTKILVRCTLVCKSWQTLINHPSFVSLHHSHSPSFLLLHLSNHLTTSPPFPLTFTPSPSAFPPFPIATSLPSLTASCVWLLANNRSLSSFVTLPLDALFVSLLPATTLTTTIPTLASVLILVTVVTKW